MSVSMYGWWVIQPSPPTNQQLEQKVQFLVTSKTGPLVILDSSSFHGHPCHSRDLASPTSSIALHLHLSHSTASSVVASISELVLQPTTIFSCVFLVVFFLRVHQGLLPLEVSPVFSFKHGLPTLPSSSYMCRYVSYVQNEIKKVFILWAKLWLNNYLSHLTWTHLLLVICTHYQNEIILFSVLKGKEGERSLLRHPDILIKCSEQIKTYL